MKFTKETLKRAVRTFLQTALAYFTTNLAVVTFTDDKATIKSYMLGLVISSVSAGVSALMNLEKQDDDEGEVEG